MAKLANLIINQLIKLAKRERQALLSGKLDRLSTLEAKKRTLLARLQSIPNIPDQAPLRELRQISRDNQQLYQAALVGVRRVRDQVANLVKSGLEEFQTYSPEGGRSAPKPHSGRLQRKA